MPDEKKKSEGEATEEKKPDTPPEEKPTEPPKEESKTEENKPTENDEGEKSEEQSETPPEQPKEEKPAESAPPELSEEDRLKEENFRLKTQLEAVKLGFNPDVMEDAVILAENIVKRDGSDISAALQAVAKKYPDWKADSKDGKSKGGFKVGADSSKQTSADDEKIRRAFGLKNKK